MIVPSHKYIRCATGLPHVAILLDLGAPVGVKTAAVSATYSTSGPDGPIWRIHARGVGEGTFPFLQNRIRLQETLKDLIAGVPAPAVEEGSSVHGLNARVKAGSQPYSLYMD